MGLRVGQDVVGHSEDARVHVGERRRLRELRHDHPAQYLETEGLPEEVEEGRARDEAAGRPALLDDGHYLHLRPPPEFLGELEHLRGGGNRIEMPSGEDRGSPIGLSRDDLRED